MAEMTLVGAINNALDQALEHDPDVILLGEDIGLNGGVFRVTDGLAAKHGVDRVVDTPLDESGIMGSAIGLAIAGMKSVPEIQFEGFLGPAYDQLVNHGARMRTRSRGSITVPMTVRVPVGGGIHAPELHSDSPEAVYAHAPGIKVLMPSTPYDAKGLLTAAINDPDPVLFFEPKRSYRTFKEEVPEERYEIEIGKGKIVSDGDDLTLVTWGSTVFQALEAIDNLPEDVSVELIDLRSISPMDIDIIAQSVSKTGRCVVAHEAPLTSGLGAEVAARVMEECFLHLEAPVQRVTGFDTIMPYYKLENEYLPESPRIQKGIEECLAY